jgi:hypothetical protein
VKWASRSSRRPPESPRGAGFGASESAIGADGLLEVLDERASRVKDIAFDCYDRLLRASLAWSNRHKDRGQNTIYCGFSEKHWCRRGPCLEGCGLTKWPCIQAGASLAGNDSSDASSAISLVAATVRTISNQFHNISKSSGQGLVAPCRRTSPQPVTNETQRLSLQTQRDLNQRCLARLSQSQRHFPGLQL